MADGSARIELVWGDGDHVFRLALKQLRELQDKTGVGPEALYRRIASGEWRVDDLRETIRLGLLGGGMEPKDAVMLVKRYFDEDERGAMQHKPIAAAVLLAALMGPPGDTAGKARRRGNQTKTTTAAASPSPDSSGTQPLSE